MGHKLHLALSGVFRVARLPPLIPPTQAEYSVGDALTVRMTSGTLTVRGNVPTCGNDFVASFFDANVHLSHRRLRCSDKDIRNERR